MNFFVPLTNCNLGFFWSNGFLLPECPCKYRICLIVFISCQNTLISGTQTRILAEGHDDWTSLSYRCQGEYLSLVFSRFSIHLESQVQRQKPFPSFQSNPVIGSKWKSSRHQKIVPMLTACQSQSTLIDHRNRCLSRDPLSLLSQESGVRKPHVKRLKLVLCESWMSSVVGSPFYLLYLD